MTIPFTIGEIAAGNPYYEDGKVRVGINGQSLDISPATARAIAVQLILSAEKVTAPYPPPDDRKRASKAA